MLKDFPYEVSLNFKFINFLSKLVELLKKVDTCWFVKSSLYKLYYNIYCDVELVLNKKENVSDEIITMACNDFHFIAVKLK